MRWRIGLNQIKDFPVLALEENIALLSQSISWLGFERKETLSKNELELKSIVPKDSDKNN